MIIRAIIEWDEETKTYTATCPELNFVSSFGDSKEDAIAKKPCFSVKFFIVNFLEVYLKLITLLLQVSVI